jgi:hypothetical protein
MLLFPALIIVLAIPTILELVPRNRICGFRTPYALSSDAAWYRANRLSGFAFLVAGLFWLAVVLLAPLVAPSLDSASRWTYGLGTVSIMTAAFASFWLVNRERTGH